jgi:prephenate dehydratase
MTTVLPIAYAGEPGAFAEDAVIAAFGDVSRTSLGSFREVFEAVAAGDAAAGVVPIENVINGTVRENYDLLLEYQLAIRGEIVVPVELCLAALPGQGLDEIQRVYSHIQALGQAEGFLRQRPWQLLTTYNTAGAGKSIVDRGERGAAAVLSPRAAAVFGLEILAGDIGDAADNRTRFIIIGPAPADEASAMPAIDGAPAMAGMDEEAATSAIDRAARMPATEGTWRTTLAFGVRNEPGSLIRALRVFADRGVNLSRLESRPSRSRAWEYVFWTDVDGSVSGTDVAAALTDLAAVTTFVRVLGSYRRATERPNGD